MLLRKLVMFTWAGFAVAAAGLFTGCGTSPRAEAPPVQNSSGADDPETDPQSDGADETSAKTYVGQVAGTLALVGLVREGDSVYAYICDGNDTYWTLSQWFKGPVSDGEFALANDPSASVAADYPARSRVLTGAISDGGISGTLGLDDGQVLSWEAEAADPKTAAGLYVGSDESGTASVVITNDHDSKGLFRGDIDGRLRPVTPPATLRPGGQVTVNVVNNNNVGATTTPVQVVAVRTPSIDLVTIDFPRLIEVTIEPIPIPTADILEIKFRDGLLVRMVNDEPKELNGEALVSAEAKALLNAVKSADWYESHTVPPNELDQMRAVAETAWGEDLADLTLYFRLQLLPGMDVVTLRAEFAALPEVEAAYIAPAAVAPPDPDIDYSVGTNGLNPMLSNPPVLQGYLAPAAQGGIDAYSAWTSPGGTGENVRLVDIERGWDLGHLDLPDVSWVNEDDLPNFEPLNRNHGTMVLGVVAGLDNGVGVSGIAHGASFWVKTPEDRNGKYSVGAAIIETARYGARPGDIILIEQQTSRLNSATLMPVEYYKPTFDAIKVATGIGMVVIEPAGNGGVSLDVQVNDYSDGHFPFAVDPETGERVKDSGAILVGQGLSPRASSIAGGGAAVLDRNPLSNYGARVDVQSWGDTIVTTGRSTAGADLYNKDGLPWEYTWNFNGTSGASAIVAGAAAVAQSVFIETRKRGALPWELRELLIASGTPPQNDTGIGPQPDLKRCIEAIRGEWAPPQVVPPGAPLIGGPPLVAPAAVTVNYATGQNDANTLILFTATGEDPDALGKGYANGGIGGEITSFGDTVTLNQSGVLKVRSYMRGKVAKESERPKSAVVSYEFTLEDGTVDQPAAFPDSGLFELDPGFAFLEVFLLPGQAQVGEESLEIWYTVTPAIAAGEPYPGGPNSLKFDATNPIRLPLPSIPGSVQPIRARAYALTGDDSVYSASAVREFYYTLQQATP